MTVREKESIHWSKLYLNFDNKKIMIDQHSEQAWEQFWFENWRLCKYCNTGIQDDTRTVQYSSARAYKVLYSTNNVGLLWLSGVGRLRSTVTSKRI